MKKLTAWVLALLLAALPLGALAEGLEIEYDESTMTAVMAAEDALECEDEIVSEAVELTVPEAEEEALPTEGMVDGESAVSAGEAADLPAGYYMVPAGTMTYSLIPPSVYKGFFTDDSFVYCEVVKSDTGRARVIFDTEYSRNWGDDFIEVYVPGDALVPLSDGELSDLRKTLKSTARFWIGGAYPPLAHYEDKDDSDLYKNGGSKVVGLGTNNPSEAEVRAFIKANPVRFARAEDTFRQAATKDPYRPAKSTKDCLDAALNLTRQIRYISGLSTDVALDYASEDDMAAKLLVTCLNGIYSPQPARPSVLADSAYDALYQQACDAPHSYTNANTASTTLAVFNYINYGTGTFDESLENAQLLLDPGLRKVMFATNAEVDSWLIKGNYVCATQTSGPGSQERVAWPAPHTPIEYFPLGSYWSMSYWHPTSLPLDYDHIEAIVVRQSDFMTWRAYPATRNTSYGSIVDISDDSVMFDFGMDRTRDLVPGVDYNVTVRDYTTGYTVRYTVNFFSLDLPACPSSCQNVLPLIRKDGVHLSWNAASGATGYVINRGTMGNGLERIAMVSADKTSYVDKDVAADGEYVYSVYPCNDQWLGYGEPVSAFLPVVDSVALDKSGEVTSPLFKDESRTPVTIKLNASVSPDYAETVLTWTSSDPKVATVDGNGLITPAGPGSTTITVTTAEGLSDSVCVTYYYPQPESIALDRTDAITLTVGETARLNAMLTPSWSVANLTWASDKPENATVEDGLVKAVRSGSATISVSTDSKLKASVNVRVVNPTASSSPSPSIKPTVSPDATAKPKSLSNAKITIVKAKAYTGKALKPAVTVKLGKKTLKKGTDYTVSYKNNKVIGTATVTVKGKGNFTGTKKATFRINPKKVKGLTLKAGTKQLTVTWEKASSVTGYQIQYSAKKGFPKASTKTRTVKKAKTVKATIKKLGSKKTYYVRIRAYKTVKGKKYYSAWSDPVKAKTK